MQKDRFVRNFMLCIFSIGINLTVNGKVTDTIAYWHVEFNQNRVLDLNGYTDHPLLKIDLDTLDGDDLLGIRYWPGCLYCGNCKTHLGIYDQQKRLVQHEDASGEWTPLVIQFLKLIEHHYRTGETRFDCYYLAGNKLEPRRVVHVLTIEFF